MKRSAMFREYSIGSLEELMQLINKLDVDVPERSAGRDKEHVESYIFARVLFASANEFAFPVKVEHKDRPDFRVVASEKTIGIEVVEASSSNEIQKGLLRERETTLGVFFVEPAIPGEEEKTAKELRAELADEVEANEAGEPWGEGGVGSPIPEWVRAISYFVAKKVRSSRASGFERFQLNWLALYDNWPIIMGEPKWDKMLASLHKQMIDDDVFATFEKIFVLSGGKILVLAQDGCRMVDDIDRLPKISMFQRIIWWVQEKIYLCKISSSRRARRRDANRNRQGWPF